jgi:phosphatidylserine/phosphatidylglycerophosphate/cardiolipin synthase-like enzyme
MVKKLKNKKNLKCTFNDLKKALFSILLLIILISVYLLFLVEGDVITGFAPLKMNNQENSYLNVFFCRNDNVSCKSEFIKVIDDADSFVYCAFYDLNIDDLKESLVNAGKNNITVKIVIESSNAEDFGIPIKKDSNPYLMHNKFCVTDNSLITGSFNPTNNGENFNDNNIVITNSTYLIKNYVEEFYELYDKRKRDTPYRVVNISGIIVENYFCPDDECEQNVIRILSTAKNNIKFMAFSFTDKDIADVLIEKQKAGINITGVTEKMQESKYSQKNRLVINGGCDVRLDGNKKMMHHKVFIIDDKIVITGSYNPTESGDKRNDENILIIHSTAVAKLFTQEFNRVWESASP